jgi:uncharacterized protein HemY
LFKYILAIFGLVFAGLIGFLAHYQPGHLVLVYHEKTLQFPLWLALILNLGFICLILLLHAFFSALSRGIAKIRDALKHYRQRKAIKAQQALSAYLQTLTNLSKANTGDIEHLHATWRSGSRAFRYHPEALLLYVDTLRKKGFSSMAENILRQALDIAWYDSWVRLYGLIPGPNEAEQLKKAQKWLSNKKDNASATLLLTLGRLSLRNRLWGQAKQYFERSIAIMPSAEAYAELGRLHEFLGDFTLGESCYKQGILSIVGQDFVQYPSPVALATHKSNQSLFSRLLGKSTPSNTHSTLSYSDPE